MLASLNKTDTLWLSVPEFDPDKVLRYRKVKPRLGNLDVRCYCNMSY
jgi:hypothetical protein